MELLAMHLRIQAWLKRPWLTFVDFKRMFKPPQHHPEVDRRQCQFVELSDVTPIPVLLGAQIPLQYGLATIR